MHEYQRDMFTAIEAGVRFSEYAINAVTPDVGGGAAPTPATKPLHQREEKAADGTVKKVDVTATDQAKEAIKDGKISAKEKTAFDKTPATQEVVKTEQARLKEAVAKAEGGSEHQRDSKGNLVLDGEKKPLALGDFKITEHEQRVTTLESSKDKQGLDALDKQIKTIKDSGQTLGLDALEQQRKTRAAEENKVVEVIEDKESLVGTLEAEKIELKGVENKDGANDYQKLREDAHKWIEQFNANGGQFHDGGMYFMDAWDEQKVDFDKLAQRFHEAPHELNNFARVQGENDNSGGADRAGMERHITEVAKNDPEKAAKISLRYQAAEELTKVFERYNTARDAGEGNSQRIAQIDAEVGILQESIEQDKRALSTESLQKLSDNNKEIAGIIPEAPAGDGSTGTGGTGGESANTGGTGGNGGTGGTGGTGSTGGNGGTGGTGGTGGNGSAATTREVAIDYSKPENREKVLVQARERNLVPAENTTFDAQGQAVYTVQPNDSYWRIADMSDGKPPHEFDSQHFLQTVTTNSERMGRDPQQGLIHPNEQIVLPGRSIDELIRLLALPTVETVADERRGNGGKNQQEPI